jgi:hypothetical protein
LENFRKKSPCFEEESYEIAKGFLEDLGGFLLLKLLYRCKCFTNM